MALILEIIGQQSLALSEGTNKVFGRQGGSIGRALTNDWVLPDPERFVSSCHALISYQSGTYYITDTSTNGVFINGAEQALGNGKSSPLQTGDQIQIGEYAISTAINDDVADEPEQFGAGAESSWSSTAELNWPDSGANQPASGGFNFAEPATPAWEAAPSEDKGMFDAAYPSESFADLPDNGDALAKPVAADDVPAINQSFKAPETQADPGFIPENWDETDFGLNDLPESNKPLMDSMEAQPLIQEPVASSTSAQKLPVQPVLKNPEPTAAQSAIPKTTAAQGDDLLHAFCTGMGIAPEAFASTDHAAIMQQLGGTLRMVTENLMSVLLARREIKSQLQAKTYFPSRSAKHNPLKHLPNADMALEAMVGRPNGAYLALSDAYQEAFTDIQSHELAVLAGMRASFAAIAERFDPDELESLFERKEKNNMFNNKKARHWEMYREYFAGLKTEISQEGIDCLLGDEFARAYDRYVNSIKSGEQ